MKVVGIIAEFNPFHKGHEYIINKAKETTGANYAIVITSGNYVQRGEPAFIDKYTKTRISLNHGADLVIELPVQFATASAEYFAQAAVSILNSLNVVDYLAFGIEHDNINELSDIADILINEPEEFKESLKNELSSGSNYPAARAKALSKFLGDDKTVLLNTPNNILAIEYIKAMKRINTTITPVGIKRINADYHDEFLSSSVNDNNRMYSATNIRMLDEQSLEIMLNTIDNEYIENYKKQFPIYLTNSFSSIAGQKLLQSVIIGENAYFDVPNYLWDKIKKNIYNYTSYSSFIDLLKSKEISYTSISRALLHIVLDIKISDITSYIKNGYGNYIRVLGFRKAASDLLNSIDTNSDVIIITKVKDYTKLLNPTAIKQFEQNLNADNMYQLISTIDYNCPKPNEYQRKLIIK